MYETHISLRMHLPSAFWTKTQIFGLLMDISTFIRCQGGGKLKFWKEYICIRFWNRYSYYQPVVTIGNLPLLSSVCKNLFNARRTAMRTCSPTSPSGLLPQFFFGMFSCHNLTVKSNKVINILLITAFSTCSIVITCYTAMTQCISQTTNYCK